MAEEGMERKLVQELAKSERQPPVRYIQREEDRPIVAIPPASAIPVVDLGRLLRSDGRDDEAAKLRSALETWGLFQAIGHEMSASFLDEVQDVARKFFQLPVEQKQKYSYLTDGKPEGYGIEPISTGNQILDWSDRLYLLAQPEDERNLTFWPENPTSFRNVLHEYALKSRKVVDHILRAIAKLLDLNEDYFANQLGDRAVAYARFNYYPSCPRPDLVFGIKPHSDGTAVTTLLQDKDVEGLQVLKDGEWFSVSPIPHALVIILGDEMEIMSNGIFKSPVHRVVTNSEKGRISVAMFHALEGEKDLGPAEELIDERRPRMYRKMKMKDYLEVFFKNYAQGKRAIDCARI